MKVLIGFIWLFTTATASPSPLGIDGRIFKGVPASRGAFPFMVDIHSISGRKSNICGGSLISSIWVLTAAHCLVWPDASTLFIILGKFKNDDADVGYDITSPDSVRINPQFSAVFPALHDIALIKIPYTTICKNIKPVRLPPLDPSLQKSYLGEVGTIAGWGRMGDAPVLPRALLYGHMKIVDNMECKRYKRWVNSNHICAASTGSYASACPGDSGGPLFVESSGELVGVMSSGAHKSCIGGHPNIFTRITPYLEWIKSETGFFY